MNRSNMHCTVKELLAGLVDKPFQKLSANTRVCVWCLGVCVCECAVYLRSINF